MMPALRLLSTGLLCFAIAAQETQPPPPAFRTTVDVVVAPVTVLDEAGGFVNGLQPHQFHLYDNGKEQNISVDVSYQPISLVIAIQANAGAETALAPIRKIGSLIEPLVIGEQGEAAVVKFDHRIETLQEFTNDSAKVGEALKKIKPGSTSSRMVDAVMTGVRMLRSRPQNRRRILLLISETRDYGSEGRAREALIEAQLSNVTIYAADMSRFLNTLTAKPQPPRPDPRPPAMTPLPPNVPATPTTVIQTTGRGARAEFLPLLLEIYRDVKAIFKSNPVEVFTKGTGGAEFGFVRQRGLEDAITRIGEELHSQYLITYNPSNKDEGGFHEITVTVAGRPNVEVRTRPGYWLATK
jgi:VWFA-related protein